MYEKNLEVCIRLISNWEYDVTLFEPESGDSVQYGFFLYADPLGEGNMKETIGNEILSWVEMMLEQKHDDEHEGK